MKMYKEPSFEPTREQMLEILEAHMKQITRTEIIPTVDANQRICAADTYNRNILPNKPISAFDGISVRFDDFIHGIPDTSNWIEGNQYDFSNTGVAIKEKYDTVIAIEDVSFDQDGKIKIHACPKNKGDYVGKIGGQVGEKEIIVYKNEEITPSLIGILISAGITKVSVYEKPRVTFLPTGDELVPWGYQVPPGKNVESNSWMLAAYIKEWGGIPLVNPIIPDHMESLKEGIQEALKHSDLVLICAGSSKGSKDYTLPLLETMGEVLVQELGHGPGKHCSLAKISGKYVIGLPGPPGGADLTAKLYVKAALYLMLHKPLPVYDTVEAIIEEEIKGLGIDFIFFMKVSIKEGQYYAKTVPLHGVTRSKSYHEQNAYLYVKKGEVFSKNSKVFVELQCERNLIEEG
ncbi:MAG TPA: molybdopterin molybdotransferase MoeA [Candidatus Merdenecus merdavium]|nr:molybdopterin molybdotransferase MoeA [Candidatus Merdenecus merdavium]